MVFRTSSHGTGLALAVLAAIAGSIAVMSEPAEAGLTALDAMTGRQMTVPPADPALDRAIELLRSRTGPARTETAPTRKASPANLVGYPSRRTGKLLILGGPEAFPM